MITTVKMPEKVFILVLFDELSVVNPVLKSFFEEFNSLQRSRFFIVTTVFTVLFNYLSKYVTFKLKIIPFFIFIFYLPLFSTAFIKFYCFHIFFN